MKGIKRPFLQYRFQVDHYIAATDQIDLGKWRIFQQVMVGKYAHVTYNLVYLIGTVKLGEKLLNARCRQSLQVGDVVNPGSRLADSSFGNISREYLNFHGCCPIAQLLLKTHG